MKWAINDNGDRVRATESGAKAAEPGTGWPVVAKVGSIKIPHWARTPGGTVDPWSEPETEWHRSWKERLVPDTHQEFTFRSGPAGYHRADAIGSLGFVIEFQHSSISPEDIAARETFYLNHAAGMIWVFDAREWKLEESPPTKLEDEDGFPNAWEIRWKHPRQSLWDVSCRMYADLGRGRMLEIHHITAETPCIITATPITEASFMADWGIAPGTPFEEPRPAPHNRAKTWRQRHEIRLQEEAKRQAARKERDDEIRRLVEEGRRRETELRAQLTREYDRGLRDGTREGFERGRAQESQSIRHARACYDERHGQLINERNASVSELTQLRAKLLAHDHQRGADLDPKKMINREWAAHDKGLEALRAFRETPEYKAWALQPSFDAYEHPPEPEGEPWLFDSLDRDPRAVRRNR